MTTNFELIIECILLFSSFIIVYKECSCFVAEYYDFKRYYMLLKVRLIGLLKNKYFLSILLINFLLLVVNFFIPNSVYSYKSYHCKFIFHNRITNIWFDI